MGRLDAVVTEWPAKLRRLSADRRLRTLSFAVALGVFAVGVVMAWATAGIESVAPLPIVLVGAAVPVSVATSAWQLRAIARSLGVDPGWLRAFRVTTLGTLSSVLPVSSGTLVRGGAVVVWGARPGPTARAFLFDALVWIVVALVVAGAAALAVGESALGGLLLAGGLAGAPLAAILARGLVPRGPASEVVASRVIGVLVEALRLFACFAALGHGVRLLEAAFLTAPGALASLLFFLPGGLGAREALTAGFAGLAGIDVAVAFLAAALNRLVGLSVLLAGEAVWWVASGVGGARRP